MKPHASLLLALLALVGEARADDTTPPGAAELASSPPAASALQWRWDTPRRLLFEVDVRLPYPMWFAAEHNKEQRAVAYQVRAVLDCSPATAERKRAVQVDCRVEDIGLTAAGMPAKEGLLEPILQEFDQRLSTASLQLQLRRDGRILNVDIEGLERSRRRDGEIHETFRLMLSRAVAGLDLQFDPAPVSMGTVWPQYQSWIMGAPTDVGTSGSVEMLHRVEEIRPDGRVVLASAAEGLVVPGGGVDKYSVRFSSVSVFDTSSGFLTERVWSAQGRPTASSAAAEGLAGHPYDQIGRLRLLEDGEQVDVGETREVAPPGVTPTTLQLWPSLGAFEP